MKHDVRFAIFTLAVASSLVGVGGIGTAGAGGGGGGGGGGGSGGRFAWCGDAAERPSEHTIAGALDPAAEPGSAIPQIIDGLCLPAPDLGVTPAQLEAARKRWMGRLMLTEAEWPDAVAWVKAFRSPRAQRLRVERVERAAWSALRPLDQFALLSTETGDSNDFALAAGALYYMADALPPSEAGRLALLTRCLTFGRDEERPLEWAVCQADLDALDAKKLAAEIRGATERTGVERMVVRLAYDALQGTRAKHGQRVKQMMARDPVYRRAFDLAREARTEWEGQAAGRAPLLAAVLAMDDARATGSRKAAAGCSERMWPLYAAAIGKLPPKRLENVRGENMLETFLDAGMGAVLQSPDAYLAANALVACEGPADRLLEKLGAALYRWPGFRGPRTAALTRLQLAQLEPDARGATIEVPSFELPLPLDRDVTRADGDSVQGVIASVKPEGDRVRVTFPASSEMQDKCTGTKRTNRISRIDSSGNLVYETVCTGWTRERVNTTPKPILVAKRYAGGLAPKRYVSIIAGVPEAVWAKPSSPTPLAAFGAALK